MSTDEELVAGLAPDVIVLARAYHGLGFNVLPTDRGKRPANEMPWKRWQTAFQSTADVGRMPWGEAVGVAAITGPVSAPKGLCLVNVDADAAPGEAVLLNLLGRMDLPRDYPWAVHTPGKGGGWHIWAYVTMADLVAELAKKGLEDTRKLEAPFPGADHIELRWNSVYTVLPGSAHPEGGAYNWVNGNGVPPATPPAGVPAARVAALGKWKGAAVAGEAVGNNIRLAPPLPDVIHEHEGRDNAMFSLACTLSRRGIHPEDILGSLKLSNARICKPALPDKDLARIVRSAGKYRPAAAPSVSKDSTDFPLSENGTSGVPNAGDSGSPDDPKSEVACAPATPSGDHAAAQPAPIHEAAHAEVLTRAWRDKYRWAPHEGSWRRWTGRVWEEAAEPVVVAAAQKVLRQHYGLCLAEKQPADEDRRLKTLHGEACRFASVAGALAFLKGEQGFHTAFDEWDAAPYALNCADGILDLRTQTLRRHDPAELCTKMTRWRYADNETTGAWERHLERCLPGADVRRQVQRDLGRALIGANLEMSLPIWYGLGRNGKSTTADAVIEGLDGYAKTAVPNLLVLQRFEQHSTDLADLAGSRLAICEEIEDGKRLNEARVKRLTGGKTESARFMRCDNFRFRPPTIFLLVNHHPVIIGTDKGIWGRLRLVPWEVSIPFPEQRPEEEMLAELMADGAWMLRWLVAGFGDWQADHHWIAEEVRVATEEYRVEQDRLAGFFARQCDLKPFGTVEVGELYLVYERDAKDGDEVPMSKIAFGKQLRNQGFRQDRRRRFWQGIRLVGVQSLDDEEGHGDKE